MTLEPTQTLKFELEEDDLEKNFSEVSNPAGYLLEISKKNKVKETHIIGRRSVKYIIGRAYTCDIIIDHPSISNKHATLEVENGLLWITDEESTNYTRIGDDINTATTNCHPNRDYQVNSKQYLTLGEVHFQYYNYVDYCARIRNGVSASKTCRNPIVSAPQEESKNAASAAVCENVIPHFNTTQELGHVNPSDSETQNKEREDFAIPQIRDDESVENVFSDDDAERAVNTKDDSCLPETQVFDPCYQELTDQINTQVFDPCWPESPGKKSLDEVVYNQKAKSPEATQAFEYSAVCAKGGDNFFAATEPIQTKLSEAQPAHFKPGTTISLQNRDQIDLENIGTEEWNGEASGCEATQAFDLNLLDLETENDGKEDGEFQCVETQVFDPVFPEEVKEIETTNDEPSGNETQAFHMDLPDIWQGKDTENDEPKDILNGLSVKRSACNLATSQEENTLAVLTPKLTLVEEIKLKEKDQSVIEGKEEMKITQEQKDQSLITEPIDAEDTNVMKVSSDNYNYLGTLYQAKPKTKRSQQSDNSTKTNLNMRHLSENITNEIEGKTSEVNNNEEILESSCRSQSNSDQQKKNITQSAKQQYSELGQLRIDKLADDVSDLTPKRPNPVSWDEIKQETTTVVESLELQKDMPEEKGSIWTNSQLHLDSTKPEPAACSGGVDQQDEKPKESILSHEPRPQVISKEADAFSPPHAKKPHLHIIARPVISEEVLKQQRSISLLSNDIVIKDKSDAQQECPRVPDPEFQHKKSQPNPCGESNERESVGGLVPAMIPLFKGDDCQAKVKPAKNSMKWSYASEVLEADQSLRRSGKINIRRAISTSKDIKDAIDENTLLGVPQENHQKETKENNRKSRDPPANRDGDPLEVLHTPTILRKPSVPKASELVPEMSEIKPESVNTDKAKDKVISEMKTKSRVEKISRKAKPKKIDDKVSALKKRKKYSRMLQKKKARKALSGKASKSARKSKSASKHQKKTTTKVQVKSKNKVTQKIDRKKRKLSVEKLTLSRKKRRASHLQKPYILQTGVSDAAQEKSLIKIGATFLSTVDRKVTHLCMDKFRTTEKVLCGLAYCDYVVSSKWLSKCLAKGNFMVEEAKFNIPSDASLKRAERDLEFKLSDVISRRNRKHSRLFQGLKLFMTNKVHPAFGRMFSAHGGTLAKTAGRKYNPDLIVLGLQEADDDAQKLVKRKFRVRTTSWVKAAIFRQKLPKVCEFRVKQIIEDLRSSYGDNISRRRSRRRETMGKVLRSIS